MQASAWLPGYLHRSVPLRGHAPRRPERRRPARGSARAAGRPPAGRVARPLRRARAEHDGHVDRRERAARSRAGRVARPRACTTTSTRATASARSGTGSRSRAASATRTSSTGATSGGTSSRSASRCAPGTASGASPGTRLFGYFDVEDFEPDEVEERVPESRRSAG